MSVKYPIGVLVMAYGGPDSLEEIPGYLADIRSGRPTPQAIMEEITHNYRSIGGESPLRELTQQQVDALAKHFDPREFKFYLGMRHWSPWLEETIRDMLADGITHAISIVMAPHYSKLSVAKYQAKIAAGLDMYRGHIQFSQVESYHDAPGLIQALANRVREGLNRWPESRREQVHVVFSAHSLPSRILEMGTPMTVNYARPLRWLRLKQGLARGDGPGVTNPPDAVLNTGWGLNCRNIYQNWPNEEFIMS